MQGLPQEREYLQPVPSTSELRPKQAQPHQVLSRPSFAKGPMYEQEAAGLQAFET